MTGAHGLPHWHDGTSPLHGARPEPKVVAATGVVLAVASLPPQAVAPYAAAALVVAGLVAAARLAPRHLARRLVPVVPVLAFTLLLPFFARGPRTEVAGVALSISGLWSMWSILAKGLLGATVMVVLASTTAPHALLSGLRALRAPAVLVAIAMFMVRFAVLIRDQARTMALARASRGHRPRWLGDVAPLAASTGSLFVRSFERGERVHAAMVSRGFTGTIPADTPGPVPARQWRVAAIVVVLAAAIALGARWPA